MPTTTTTPIETTPDEISQTFWTTDGTWINDMFVPAVWHFWNLDVPALATPEP